MRHPSGRVTWPLLLICSSTAVTHAWSAAARSQEFADFARSRDIAEGKRQVFELPYAIDGDKVSLLCCFTSRGTGECRQYASSIERDGCHRLAA